MKRKKQVHHPIITLPISQDIRRLFKITLGVSQWLQIYTYLHQICKYCDTPGPNGKASAEPPRSSYHGRVRGTPVATLIHSQLQYYSQRDRTVATQSHRDTFLLIKADHMISNFPGDYSLPSGDQIFQKLPAFQEIWKIWTLAIVA